MHSSKSSIIILSYNLRLLKIELSILFPLIKKAFDFNLKIFARWLLPENFSPEIFKTVINEHKNTPYYPEAIFRSIEAYVMLGINNKVLDYSAILKKDFPNSEWNILASNLKEEYGIKAD